LGAALLSAILGSAPAIAADPPPFELPGPTLRVSVTREGETLPIGQVPSLAEGDTLSIEADLPEDQGARFILVSAFLRGATNPPPKDWVETAETWKKKEKDRTLSLTVPKGARQMVLFLVPDTGGAEGTLSDAVRGKPGEFLRATQDLNQASLDRSRLDAFMAAIHAQENRHPEFLRSVAPALARSLSMKLNEECLSKVIELQAACLLDNRESLVLADVHSSSMAETLAGAPTDLVLQLSATREAGYGFYSPYIGVIRDVARLFGAFSNPQFDYLPTLSMRHGDRMKLLLNSAPSFQKPKSVLVVAMPSIEANSPPRLRSMANGPICAVGAGTVLPVEGAPLIYSTDYARTMMVTLTAANGETAELPVRARADRGGYVLMRDRPLPPAFQGTVKGHLYGQWGFDRFEGPDFALQLPDTSGWSIAGETPMLVVGRDNLLPLKGAAPACVENVTLRQGKGQPQAIGWKVEGQDRLALTLPLAERKPGELSIEVKYQGVAEPSRIDLRSYGEASRLDGLRLHAGDKSALLSGQRLDQVESISLGNLRFRPAELSRDGNVDRLHLELEGAENAPQQGMQATAHVRLKDGRSVKLPVEVAAPRPQLSLVSKTVTAGPAPAGMLALTLTGDSVLPDNGHLVFSVRAEGSARFTPSDRIEVAGASGEAVLQLSSGKGLRIESAGILVATLDSAQLAPSLFGPLRYRLVQGEEASDWQPLVTLARLPRIESVDCDATSQACVVRGRELFLVEALGTTPTLEQPVTVAHGYTGSTLKVGLPQDGRIYLRLRDALDVIASLPAA